MLVPAAMRLRRSSLTGFLLGPDGASMLERIVKRGRGLRSLALSERLRADDGLVQMCGSPNVVYQSAAQKCSVQ
jgi:hypothetical protein